MKFNWIERLKNLEIDRSAEKSKSRRLLIGGVLAMLVVVVSAVQLLGLGSSTDDVMSFRAEHRTLVAMVVERGVLRAAETVTFNAPRLRRGGNIQILEMAEEGSLVEPGDLVVRFDASSLDEQIRGRENDVERSEAQLRKTIAQQESQMASLQASYEQAQHRHEQAALSLQRMAFEAEINKRQEELNFKKSELTLQKAREAIDTRKSVNEAALQRLRLRLNRDRDELEELRGELLITEMYTESPGLVTYENTWGSNGMTKVKVGDSPYSGQAIISLPDLSKMAVDISISELDIHKIAEGHKALVHLDAYPDRVYPAEVTEVSQMASRMGRSQMKVFECRVVLDETDLSLRPGMTAQISIITHYDPEALVVPLEAIFRREGEPMVFTLDGGPREVPVVLGADNGSYVVIQEGIELGTLVALRDPFTPLEAIESAGAEALTQQRGTGADGNMSFDVHMPGGGRGMSVRIFR